MVTLIILQKSKRVHKLSGSFLAAFEEVDLLHFYFFLFHFFFRKTC